MSSAIYPDPPETRTAVCGHGEQQRLSNARLRLTFYNAPVAYCGPARPGSAFQQSAVSGLLPRARARREIPEASVYHRRPAAPVSATSKSLRPPTRGRGIARRYQRWHALRWSFRAISASTSRRSLSVALRRFNRSNSAMMSAAVGSHISSETIDAGPYQEMRSNLLSCAKQLVDVALAVVDMDAPSRITEEFGGLL